MRALAGPAMLLVMVGGYLIYHLSSKEDAPSREFTNLEFAGADEDHTGSCYSLDTVLFASRAFNKAARTWTSPREDTWTLTLDDVVQGYAGPQSIFQKFTFEKQGVNQDGKVVGRFRATGVRPKVSERLLAAGIRLPASMFEGVVEVR